MIIPGYNDEMPAERLAAREDMEEEFHSLINTDNINSDESNTVPLYG